MSLENYEIKNIIGQGTFALVKEAVHIPTQKTVAIKIYSKQSSKKVIIKAIKREVKCLKITDHENIIKLLAQFSDKNNIYLVMEFGGPLNLQQYLFQKEEKRFSEVEAKQIFKQIVIAINYLHQQKIAHRDIKLDNIMIVKEKVKNIETIKVKVIDFGFSIKLNKNTKQRLGFGTKQYSAPEILSKVLYDPLKSDIWSLGVLFYVMVCGKFPFSSSESLFRIRTRKIQYPSSLSHDARDFIESMLIYQQQIRPTCQIILNDKWLNDCKQIKDTKTISFNLTNLLVQPKKKSHKTNLSSKNSKLENKISTKTKKSKFKYLKQIQKK